MKFVSEQTLIPLGTALFIFGSGAIFSTRVSVIQEAHGARLDRQGLKMERMESRQEQSERIQEKYFQEIRERLIRIEMTVKK